MRELNATEKEMVSGGLTSPYISLLLASEDIVKGLAALGIIAITTSGLIAYKLFSE